MSPDGAIPQILPRARVATWGYDIDMHASWSVSETLVEGCVERQLGLAPAWLRHEVAPRRLRGAAERQVREDLARVANIEFAREFRRACPLAGAELEDYAFKLLPIGVAQWLVTSLRFRGGDLDWPFVQIDHSTISIVDRNGWEIVERALADAYAHLAPRAIRIFDPDDGELRALSHRRVACDVRIFAATLGQLRSVELPPSSTAIEVTRVEAVSSDSYARYREVYEELRGRSPIHRPRSVWHEEQDDLSAAARNGLVVEVHLDGEWAGLFAYTPTSELFFDGLCVLEAALTAAARGRGLAAHVHRRMADLVDAPDDAVLYGHVVEGNEPSARAAMRAGRRLSGAYRFVDLRGWRPRSRV